MARSESTTGLMLCGLDGSNPLGFLAAIGTAVVLHSEFPRLCLGWKPTGEGWRPWLTGCGDDDLEFASTLLTILKHASTDVFEIDNKMPFDANKFSHHLRIAHEEASIAYRRDADFLCSFGTELYPDLKTCVFQDSSLRMVRSGDSAGQGFPVYAKETRKSVDLGHVLRTLFHSWDYRDEGYSLRWDPIEDQRYALRWRDPSKSNLSDGLGTMLAANSLAVEALPLFPTLLVGKKATTTGFQRRDRRVAFVWPIWRPPTGVDTIRSLVAAPELHTDPLQRSLLAQRGIEEIYSSQRVQQNQYYSNFLPAHPR